MWELAVKAQEAAGVDPDSLSNRKSIRAIIDRRSWLGSMIPEALNDLIESAGRRTYRLELPRSDIQLFAVAVVGDGLVDVISAASE